MQKLLQKDPAWDGNVSGIRCSSTGDAANSYQDPSSIYLESNGRSAAGLIPSGANGLRGVVIPRATALGGSRGFDPHKPRLVNIDPHIKGQSCVIDLSKISKASMDKAIKEAKENPFTQDDPSLLASQVYHNLAVGFEPVGMESSAQPKNNRTAPLGLGYVVPKAKLGGGQESTEQLPLQRPEQERELISPSVTPRYTKKMEKEPEIEESVSFFERNKESGLIRQIPSAEVKQAIKFAIPTTKVTFEMNGWGTFEAMYHDVIVTDCLLILCWHTGYEGMKFFPPVTDIPMTVKIGNSAFTVFSYGSKFQHNNYEYYILVLNNE